MTRPATILDLAVRIERAPGKNPHPPRWRAVHAAFYGLGLTDADAALLRASTRRANFQREGGPPFRELWARVGRRGRKSVQAALIAVFEACFGGHARYLLAGERGLIAIISKDVAGSTLVARFVELHADALGIKSKWTAMGAVRILELEDCAIAIACFACSAKAPRGYAVPVVIADELAHWQFDDGDEYVNSIDNVLAAVRPAMAQFPHSKFIAISSPLGSAGLFHETVERNLGDDAEAGVLAVEGPTWEWNPEISEARTREIERDPEVHRREFGAIPGDNNAAAFPESDVRAAFEPRPEFFRFHAPIATIDMAVTGDSATAFTARWGDPDRTPRLKMLNGVPQRRAVEFGGALGYVDEFEPIAERPLLYLDNLMLWKGPDIRAAGTDAVIAEIKRTAVGAGAREVVGDQHGQGYLDGPFARPPNPLRYICMPTTGENKPRAVALIRTWLRDRQLSIDPASPWAATFRDQLLNYRQVLSGNGFKYTGGSKRGVDDFVGSLVTFAVLSLGEKRIDGAPTNNFMGGRYLATGFSPQGMR